MDTEGRELLARKFSDKGRKVRAEQSSFLVPHKFTPDGELLSHDNVNIRRDVSRLSLKDLQLLILWKENKWDDEVTLKAAGLERDQAEKTFKKLGYFKMEDARVRALAAQASPDRIIAKDIENLETGKLSDSQHKSLDRLAKIVGAFKPSSQVNIQQNVFNAPAMSPEAWEAVKQIAEREAEAIDVQSVG